MTTEDIQHQAPAQQLRCSTVTSKNKVSIKACIYAGNAINIDIVKIIPCTVLCC